MVEQKKHKEDRMNILALIPLLNIKTIATVFNLVQLVVKTIKELLTVIVNAALPFIPNASVQKIRDILNKVDAWLEAIKNAIFKLVK
jgi:hypothetical protein